jgi:hypothetical protein
VDDVILMVRCGVELWHDNPKGHTAEAVKQSIMEAIEEALAYGENRGFNHTLSDDLAIVVKEVKAQ